MNKILLLFLLAFWLFTLFQGKAQSLLPPLEEMPLFKKAFTQLFADCPALLEIRKPKFQDFGKHIVYYTNDCKPIAGEYFLEN